MRKLGPVVARRFARPSARPGGAFIVACENLGVQVSRSTVIDIVNSPAQPILELLVLKVQAHGTAESDR